MFAAGFNRMSAVTNLDDELGTAGLANCIAVVGFNRTLGRMAMAHFDTGTCSTGLGWNEQKFWNFRKWFVQQTRANEFKVGLGLAWFDTANSTGPKTEKGYPLVDEMRFRLITTIMSVFNYDPIQAGKSFTFTAAGNLPQLRVRTGETHMPQGWGQHGTPIPYNTF